MTQQPLALTPEQVKRYSRHIIMGDVGSAGQRKLMQSKALIVGAGGLGSPSAIYLALAGVGTVGIVDFDVVEISNLQRQILHHSATSAVPSSSPPSTTSTPTIPTLPWFPTRCGWNPTTPWKSSASTTW